jgi:hypothetical protein
LNEEGARILEEQRVACITTNSLREILKLFPMEGEEPRYLITRLRARASNLELDKPLVDDREYGIKGYLDRGLDSFTMDYELKWDKNGNPKNPIDRTAIERIEEKMRKLSIEDAAVKFLKVMIRDPKIGELAGVPEELFHVTIESDPVDGDKDEEKVKEHKVNEALIKESGFKHRILHVRKMIDRRQELTVPTSRQIPIIWWKGKTWASLKSPVKIAQRLREHFRPYSLIKRYGADTEDVLVLLSVER